MKITKHDDVYKATRITGPNHNYLGLVITNDEPCCIKCIPKYLSGEDSCLIDEAKLISAVTKSILSINSTLPIPLFVERIEYVPSDTPDYDVYAEITKSIAYSYINDCS